MPKAISNTSPLLYLYRIGAIVWLPQIFTDVWTTSATIFELEEGQRRGYDVPAPGRYEWLKVIEPNQLPSEWFALDLGAGELSALSLGLENPDYILLLDDALARRTAKAAGLDVWGTLRVILEAKRNGLIKKVKPHVINLGKAGLWFSDEIFERILKLAKEK